MKSLLALLLPTLACTAPSAAPNDAKLATSRMSIVHGEGPARADITSEAAPIFIALAAAALDFGISSLKRMTLETAALYEVKTKAAGVARLGIRLPASYFDPVEFVRADVFVVARAIELQKPNPDGLIPLPPKGTQSFDTWSQSLPTTLVEFLNGLTAKLTDPQNGAWSRKDPASKMAKDLVAKALYEVAPREDKDGRISVVSMVAVIDADAPKSSNKDDSASVYQLALRCYSYPLVMEKQGSAALPPSKVPSVTTILSLLLEGPKGYKDVDRFPEYLHEASFQLKSDAARKQKPGTWQVPESGSGWVARSDALGAAPFSTYVTTRALLLETSDVKKSLERLSEFLGGVKLKPSDVGID